MARRARFFISLDKSWDMPHQRSETYLRDGIGTLVDNFLRDLGPEANPVVTISTVPVPEYEYYGGTQSVRDVMIHTTAVVTYDETNEVPPAS